MQKLYSNKFHLNTQLTQQYIVILIIDIVNTLE